LQKGKTCHRIGKQESEKGWTERNTTQRRKNHRTWSSQQIARYRLKHEKKAQAQEPITRGQKLPPELKHQQSTEVCQTGGNQRKRNSVRELAHNFEEKTKSSGKHGGIGRSVGTENSKLMSLRGGR